MWAEIPVWHNDTFNSLNTLKLPVGYSPAPNLWIDLQTAKLVRVHRAKQNSAMLLSKLVYNELKWKKLISYDKKISKPLSWWKYHKIKDSKKQNLWLQKNIIFFQKQWVIL